jgi:hypothetical protein
VYGGKSGLSNHENAAVFKKITATGKNFYVAGWNFFKDALGQNVGR